VGIDEHGPLEREGGELHEAVGDGELDELARRVLAGTLEACHVSLGEEPVVALEHRGEGLGLDQLERAAKPGHLLLWLLAAVRHRNPRLEHRNVAANVGGHRVVPDATSGG